MKELRIRFANCPDYAKLMLIVGLITAVPLFVLPFYPEEIAHASSFYIPSVTSVILGLIYCQEKTSGGGLFARRSTLARSSLTILFSWGWAFLIGAMPFMLSRELSFVQSLFESVCGYTTTAFTVMDVAAVPKMFLFHRSFMEFCGGIAFIIMVVMFVADTYSMDLYSADDHRPRLMPNLRYTAVLVIRIFLALLVIGTSAYCAAGMDLFEGLCTAMSVLSTGGFSVRAGSIGSYNSLAVEAVTVILMLVGMVNFAVLLLLARRKFRQFARVSEIRFMFAVIFIAIIIVTASLLASGSSFAASLRPAVFNVLSALSTTGFATADFTLWPAFAKGVLMLLMLAGGCFGSMSGGIKLARIYIMLRLVVQNLRRRISSFHAVTSLSYVTAQGETPISRSLVADTTAFISCYLGIFTLGSLLLTLTAGCSLGEAMFEFASAMGTVGISAGITGPEASTGTLLVEMAGMILGQLEIFIVFIGAYSLIRKIKRLFS